MIPKVLETWEGSSWLLMGGRHWTEWEQLGAPKIGDFLLGTSLSLQSLSLPPVIKGTNSPG